MSAVAAAGQIVGTGIQVYGDITSANDQAQLDQERASIAQQQANEIQSREVANEAIKNQQAYRQKMQFGSSYAASGKAGVGLGGQLQIQNQADLQNMVSNREAQFQENMLNQQAGIDTSLSNQELSGLPWEVAGTIAGGLGGAAKTSTSGGSNPGYGGTQGMGAYPSASNNFGTSQLQMPALGSGAFGGG